MCGVRKFASRTILKQGEEAKKVLDALAVERYCCRSVFLGQVDLIDIAGQFKKS
ncbi:DNA-directed RNA polymerase subunit N [Candidatus Woesearchaeota archaeon]|nr:DNA-directed RNA polymerase subunit N [Candidatus Woesearchaeota archaeon]